MNRIDYRLPNTSTYSFGSSGLDSQPPLDQSETDCLGSYGRALDVDVLDAQEYGIQPAGSAAAHVMQADDVRGGVQG